MHSLSSSVSISCSVRLFMFFNSSTYFFFIFFICCTSKFVYKTAKIFTVTVLNSLSSMSPIYSSTMFFFSSFCLICCFFCIGTIFFFFFAFAFALLSLLNTSTRLSNLFCFNVISFKTLLFNNFGYSFNSLLNSS